MIMPVASALKAVSAAIPVGNSAAFQAAATAMAELGVAGCIGAACVEKGLLDSDTVRSLSQTTFKILLPCFLGTGIIRTVSKYGLSFSSLGVPLIAIMHCYIMFTVSRLALLPLMGIDYGDDRGRATAVTCGWSNSATVPLIFLEALFRDSPDLLARSYGQVSLFLVGWSPFFWAFGRRILVQDAKVTGSGSSLQDFLQSTKKLFPPPVIGILTGLFLAISPFRPWILKTGRGQRAPLSIIFNSFENLGRAANPLSLLVLTASLAMGARKKENPGTTGMEQQNSSGGMSPMKAGLQRWATVSIARFILSPILMLGLCKAMQTIGLLASPSGDPLAWFALILQASMPPAQNSVLLLQVMDKPDEASRLARFLFAMYATSMVPVVLIVSKCLSTLGLA